MGSKWRRDNQNNDTQYNGLFVSLNIYDNQYDTTQHKDTQHNGLLEALSIHDTQYCEYLC
jgi:hypothetical protein